jgi:hypothetical protein
MAVGNRRLAGTSSVQMISQYIIRAIKIMFMPVKFLIRGSYCITVYGGIQLCVISEEEITISEIVHGTHISIFIY